MRCACVTVVAGAAAQVLETADVDAAFDTLHQQLGTSDGLPIKRAIQEMLTAVSARAAQRDSLLDTCTTCKARAVQAQAALQAAPGEFRQREAAEAAPEQAVPPPAAVAVSVDAAPDGEAVPTLASEEAVAVSEDVVVGGEALTAADDPLLERLAELDGTDATAATAVPSAAAPAAGPVEIA